MYVCRLSGIRFCDHVDLGQLFKMFQQSCITNLLYERVQKLPLVEFNAVRCVSGQSH